MPQSNKTPRKGFDVAAGFRRAKELIATEDRWVRGRAAADRHGDYVPPNSPAACRRCLTGACYVAFGPERLEAARLMLKLQASQLFDEGSPEIINDSFGFDAAHIVLDAAIEAYDGLVLAGAV